MPSRWRESIKRWFGRWTAPILLLCLRLTGRRAGAALLYHAVVEGPDPRPGRLLPEVTANEFAWQLRHLRRFYEVVPVESLAAAVARRSRGQRFPVALTFDDDLPESVSITAPLLESHRTPATFFLTGASLERPRGTWWERLQRCLDQGYQVADVVARLPNSANEPLGDPSSSPQKLALRIGQLSADAQDAVAETLLEVGGPDPPDSGLTRNDVAHLSRVPGITIGFHTRWHYALPRLSDSDLASALTDGRGELEDCCGYRLDLIAYPYGSVDRRVAEAARSNGYRFGFTAKRGAVTPRTDPLLVGRCDAAAMSTSRGAFWVGVARTLMIRDNASEI